MKPSAPLLFGFAFLVIAGSALYLSVQASTRPVAVVPAPSSTVTSSPAVTVATIAPTPSPVASPTPSPSALKTFSSAALSLSFQYPDGFSATEDASQKIVTVESGTQSAIISYDSAQAGREVFIKAAQGAKETDVAAQGATIRLYTYPNPSVASRTLASAYWTGAYSFSADISWDAYATTDAEGPREASEVKLLEAILPTVVVSK